jgi:hypothetical protein
MRAVCACALIAAAALPGALAAQRMEGRVVDVASRRPIAAADVRLVRGNAVVATAVSDRDGRFLLVAPDFGRYHLVAVHVGYAEAQSAAIDLNAEGTFTAEMAMSVEPVEVAEISVVVPRSRYLETRGFYDRMESGTGDYVTGDQLRRRNQQSLVDVLRNMRGVKIQRVNWKSEVYLAGANCLPQIVVDGVTVRYGGKSLRTEDALSVEDLVNVSHIEGIEVYRGSSGVPIEFEGPNAACGVIVVWTRVR